MEAAEYAAWLERRQTPVQLVRFPEPTQAWILYLQDVAGLPVPVGGDRPRAADGGEEILDFVRVVSTGGARQNLVVDSPQVAFECYGADDGLASELAQDTSKWVYAAGGTYLQPGVLCKGITTVSRPGRLPDPDTRASRYTFTVQTALRGTIERHHP